MATETITVNLGPVNITANIDPVSPVITVGDVQVDINFSATLFNSAVNEDEKLYLDGVGGSTYFKFNSSSSLVELWVDGVKQKEWGAVDENPFA